jgi:hypothetical protein
LESLGRVVEPGHARPSGAFELGHVLRRSFERSNVPAAVDAFEECPGNVLAPSCP